MILEIAPRPRRCPWRHRLAIAGWALEAAPTWKRHERRLTTTLLRELATNSAELDADTAARILDDTIQWLRKRLRNEEARALTERLRGEADDWRAVLEEKQRLQEQSMRQEHRRTSITT